MNRTPNSCQIFEDVLFRKNKKDGEEETPKCERKFKSAHKRWKSDWYYDEPKTRGTKRRLDVQNNQVNPFLEQEARGFAILQRRHRFMQLLGDEEDPAVTEKRPPGYITQTQQELFQKDVQDLMVDYWKNAAACRKMQESWKREYELDKLQLLRAHKDRHGRLYAWTIKRKSTASMDIVPKSVPVVSGVVVVDLPIPNFFQRLI
ncbi:hypothetical protein CNMCM5623_001861 [Aspergillus felis]|uniref:Uncharacterized protein n=1 Tax=Aspergillus felis TaxID=1287682 RepID=A0A8H6QAF5_9EURO|nr:hypothetical protein CNMCM5623_001861 [Aspergillus felis]